MSRTRAFFVEWKARRDGRRGMSSNIAKATRDVTGPTGWVFSNAWDKLDQHGDAYMKSFDRRVPPSIFVSERDRTRFGQPMPIIERCLEDHGPNAVQPQSSAPPDSAEKKPAVPLVSDDEQVR